MTLTQEQLDDIFQKSIEAIHASNFTEEKMLNRISNYLEDSNPADLTTASVVAIKESMLFSKSLIYEILSQLFVDGKIEQ